MNSCFRNNSLLIGLLIMVLCTRCGHENGTVQVVPVNDAKKMILENKGNPEFVILDVRTPGEFSSGHLEGAINLDYNAYEFESRISRMDKNKTYLVYCRAGNRSSSATDLMSKAGFKSLRIMDGGITKWAEENLPVVMP